ncbi:hypothetical protein MSAN_02224600 [Mycena sanguinolenta]|uniref:Uncharacterized protein n=1 Tax=Mycena sanguinolenta TaxID=230812 RepID=A0A8H6XBI6_9AGAR|nr:hypothetical protein MSAN_02224600 [Mycena sanguinolenta]
MRRYSRGASRLLAQPVRWNSTAGPLPKVSQEPVDPPASSDRSPRRFPRLRVDDGTPFAPNLGAIAANAAQGTLSARLAAARLAGSENPAQESTPPHTGPAVLQELDVARRAEMDARETTSGSPARLFPTISQEKLNELSLARREERLAREATGLSLGATSSAPPPNPSAEDSKAALDAVIRHRHELLAARRAERLARQSQEAALKNRIPQPRAPNLNLTQTPGFDKTSEDGQSIPSGMGRGFLPRGEAPTAQQTGRGEMSIRGSTRGGRGRGRGRGAAGGVGRRRNGGDDKKPEDDDDFMAQIGDWLESGDVHFATALAPELPTTHSLHRELRSQTPDSKSVDRKLLRESLGGDYSRFVPQNPQLFIASARKIGPVNHSSVVLAHAKGVLEKRTHTQEVVAKAA